VIDPLSKIIHLAHITRSKMAHFQAHAHTHPPMITFRQISNTIIERNISIVIHFLKTTNPPKVITWYVNGLQDSYLDKDYFSSPLKQIKYVYEIFSPIWDQAYESKTYTLELKVWIFRSLLNNGTRQEIYDL